MPSFSCVLPPRPLPSVCPSLPLSPFPGGAQNPPSRANPRLLRKRGKAQALASKLRVSVVYSDTQKSDVGGEAGELGQNRPPEGRSVVRPVLESIYFRSELGFPTAVRL